MSDLTNRQKLILRRVIKEYIKTAIPISSDFLKAEGFLDVSPATIRIDLAELTDKGYLEKPYISGGRVPTDQGYRFFVNELEIKSAPRQENCFREIFAERQDAVIMAKNLADLLADYSASLALVFLPEASLCLREGWERVSREPEFNDIIYWQNFLHSLTELEQKITALPLPSQNIRIFIGQEGPWRHKDYSFVVAEGYLNVSRRNYHTYCAIAGPKRMDFNRNFSLISQLAEMLNKYY